MNLHFIPYTIAILTFIAINACFIIAASYGHIPWCFPYIEGCVSISKASRNIPEVHIYRFAILISATIMMMYWILCGRWLRQLDQSSNQKASLPNHLIFVYVGVIASICLAINAALMGDSEGVLKSMRRESVRVFFIGSVLAQCLFAYVLTRFVKQKKLQNLAHISKYKTIVCLCQLAFAVFFASIEPLMNNKAGMVNMVEWNIVLLIIVFFILTGISWKNTQYRFSTELGDLNNSG